MHLEDEHHWPPRSTMEAGHGQHFPMRAVCASAGDAGNTSKSTSRGFIFKTTEICHLLGEDVLLVCYLPNAEATVTLVSPCSFVP